MVSAARKTGETHQMSKNHRRDLGIVAKLKQPPRTDTAIPHTLLAEKISQAISKPVKPKTEPVVVNYGDQVQVQYLDIDILKIDHTYQRPPSEKWIKKLMATWNWGNFGVLEISHRAEDGEYYILDGQQRFQALKRNPEILKKLGARKIKCNIHELENAKAEAKKFLELNTHERVDAFETFQADVVVGNPEAVALSNLITGVYGFTISNSKKVGNLRGIQGIREKFHTDPEAMETVFELILPRFQMATGSVTPDTGMIIAFWFVEHKLNVLKPRKTLEDYQASYKVKRSTPEQLNEIIKSPTVKKKSSKVSYGQGNRNQHSAHAVVEWLNHNRQGENRIPDLGFLPRLTTYGDDEVPH